jgi:hypothetical protein
MSRLTPQQRIIQHRQELKKLIAETRSRQGMVAFSGYVGGYCDNSDCAVRQVLVRVSGYNEPIEEVRCPACRSLLLLGNWDWDIAVATGEEFSRLLDEHALQGVWAMLKRQNFGGGGFAIDASDLRRDVTLDDLAQAFRERDAKPSDAKQYDEPGDVPFFGLRPTDEVR